jgi:ribosomal protein S18 acetylase RimI-like enzyme
MEVEIRSAREEDLPTLVELLAVLFSIEADFRPDGERQGRGLRAMLVDDGRRAVLVAEAGGRVVGMVTGQLVVSTAEGNGSCWVEDLVVAEAWRGRGLGRRLLEAAEAWARVNGATRLQLVADRDNLPALACYRRLGWRSTRLVALRRGL